MSAKAVFTISVKAESFSGKKYNDGNKHKFEKKLVEGTPDVREK